MIETLDMVDKYKWENLVIIFVCDMKPVGDCSVQESTLYKHNQNRILNKNAMKTKVI